MGTRGVVFLTVTVMALAGATAPGAHAAGGPRPGTLDPSFGRGGKVFAASPPGFARSEFLAAARAPDGSLILDLRREDGAVEYREIERRRPDGSLDRSFGGDGRVRVGDGRGLALRADGSILVGTGACGPERGSLLLLDPSGHRDPGFGKNGCAPQLGFAVNRVSVAPDGGVLLAGLRAVCPCNRMNGPQLEPSVAKLLPDGSADPSFGQQGVVHLRADLGLPGEMNEAIEALRAVDLAPTADGGMAVADGNLLLRLDSGGKLSPGFGKDGLVPLEGVAVGLLPLADGRLVVVAATEPRAPFELVGRVLVSRFHPDGAPDLSFGSGGKTQLALPAEATPRAVAHAPGEGALIAGELVPGEDCRPGCAPTSFLARMRGDGQPDSGYGNGGLALLPFPAPGEYPGSAGPLTALVASPEGAAVVAGGELGEDAFAIATTPDGSPDDGFATGGILLERHHLPPDVEPTGIALDQRGGITVAAEGTAGSHEYGGFLLRFRRDGRQRPGSGGTGVASTSARGEIQPLPGGRVVSWWEGRDELFAVGKGGTAIPGYGHRGVVKMPPDFEARATAPDRGGGTLVVGTIGEQRAMGVLRLGPRGRPRAGFGHHGLAKVRFGREHALAFAAVAQADDGVVLAGWVNGRTGAARLRPDGRLDRSFGSGGRVRGLIGKGTYGTEIAGFAGGVVVGATADDSPPALAGVVRLDRRGRPVRGFGRRGIVHPPPDGRLLGLFARGRRIVVVTDTEYVRRSSGGVELRRYLADGSPDRRYGDRGLARGAAGQRRFFDPVAAVQQPDGKIVVAGAAWDGVFGKTELLRFR
jgi:uncharacterized delta-60 repeat protein